MDQTGIPYRDSVPKAHASVLAFGSVDSLRHANGGRGSGTGLLHSTLAAIFSSSRRDTEDSPASPIPAGSEFHRDAIEGVPLTQCGVAETLQAKFEWDVRGRRHEMCRGITTFSDDLRTVRRPFAGALGLECGGERNLDHRGPRTRRKPHTYATDEGGCAKAYPGAGRRSTVFDCGRPLGSEEAPESTGVLAVGGLHYRRQNSSAQTSAGTVSPLGTPGYDSYSTAAQRRSDG